MREKEQGAGSGPRRCSVELRCWESYHLNSQYLNRPCSLYSARCTRGMGLDDPISHSRSFFPIRPAPLPASRSPLLSRCTRGMDLCDPIPASRFPKSLPHPSGPAHCSPLPARCPLPAARRPPPAARRTKRGKGRAGPIPVSRFPILHPHPSGPAPCSPLLPADIACSPIPL